MKSHRWMWTTIVYLFAALVTIAQAEIVYTPVNVRLPTNGYYAIDLNHDGITDFTFHSASGQRRCPDGPGGGPFWYLTVQPAGAGGIVGTSYAAALQSGVPVDFRQSFYRNTAYMYDVMKSTRCPFSSGNWVHALQRYLGLEFQINGQTHYGWAELSTNGETGVDFLFGFAYETIPFKPILTGQTMDSPGEPAIDSGSAESTVPEPTAPVAASTSDPKLQSSSDNGPVGMAVQDNPSQDRKSKHQRYKLIDLGTFGGPNNVGGGPIPPGPNQLNNQGTVVAGADTSTPDPNCFIDCFVNHAYQFREGVLEDLGTLPGINLSSYATDISPNGRRIVGLSENGTTDPLTGFQEYHAVLWGHDGITDLGTLGGNLSMAFSANNHGQVVGGALNTIPDPWWLVSYPLNPLGDFYVFGPGATQSHAFLWQDGTMQDLGTLGGPDSVAYSVNEHAQIAGQSFTNNIPNPVTGLPTAHPFLWEDGEMRDIGTLGGTIALPAGLNNRGQVIGVSLVAGDISTHPFLWDEGRLTDLGTLGGDLAGAFAINEAGEIVGYSAIQSGHYRPFFWKDGVLTNLGTVDGLSDGFGDGINSRHQIVGQVTDFSTSSVAFLWEKGGPMVDLNTLVPPGSKLHLDAAYYINDRGEISGVGTLSNGDTRTFLLIPDGDCDSDCEGRIAASQSNAAPAQNAPTMKQGSESPISPLERFRSQMRQRYHLSGQTAAPRD